MLFFFVMLLIIIMHILDLLAPEREHVPLALALYSGTPHKGHP